MAITDQPSVRDQPVAIGQGHGGTGTGVKLRQGKVTFYLAAGWFGLVAFLAITADLLPLRPYGELVGTPFQNPGFRLGNPLGTDDAGRSELSRLVFGARASLTVALLATTIAFLLGVLVGTYAGYKRGWSDRGISLIVDVVLAFPPLILLMAVVAMLQPKESTIIIALSVLFMVTFIRLARAQSLSLSRREFVVAARGTGARSIRILAYHILPNVAVPLLAYAFVVIATSIVIEGSLSFLGIGIPPPTPSWGGMIADGRVNLSNQPVLVFIPSVVLLLTVLSLNVLGDWASRRWDDRTSRL